MLGHSHLLLNLMVNDVLSVDHLNFAAGSTSV